MKYSEVIDLVHEKEFKVELATDDYRIFREIVGCADISISYLIQKTIENIVNSHRYIRNNNYLQGRHAAKITYTQNSFFRYHEPLSLQKVIDDEVYTLNSIYEDDDNYLRLLGLKTSQKTFLRYLCEREILEVTIADWETNLNMKKDLKEDSMREITLRDGVRGTRSRKCKRGYLRREIERCIECIKTRERHLNKIFEGYIMWSGNSGKLEKEMEHVISWMEDTNSFEGDILSKNNSISRI